MTGTLFLVVGASGVGKDSLIDGARRRLAGEPGYVFARRTITRPGGAGGEDHEAIDAAEFARRDAAGGFALSWRANGLAYGIPATIAADLAAGRHVIANVSRLALDAARRRFPAVRVIWVTAPLDLVARRLAARGRESAADIAARLARVAIAEPHGPDVTVLANAGNLDDGIAAMIVALRRPFAAVRHQPLANG